MAAAEDDADENHWPGFVDALSTIVMVVTFLLIILAIAIFALSLNVAKIAAVTVIKDATPTLENAKTIAVKNQPTTLPDEADAQVLRRSVERLVLRFEGTTLDIDPEARAELGEYFAQLPEIASSGAEMSITAYFNPDAAGYTKEQRIGYYRVMAVRNVLIEEGFSGSLVNVFVREAANAEGIDTVQVERRQ